MSNVVADKVFIREVTGALPKFPRQKDVLKHGHKRWTYKPHAYATGKWFYVEIHVTDHGTYGPAAIGVAHENEYRFPEMLHAFVCDHLRRQGLGRKLSARLAPVTAGSGLPKKETLGSEGSGRVKSGPTETVVGSVGENSPPDC